MPAGPTSIFDIPARPRKRWAYWIGGPKDGEEIELSDHIIQAGFLVATDPEYRAPLNRMDDNLPPVTSEAPPRVKYPIKRFAKGITDLGYRVMYYERQPL